MKTRVRALYWLDSRGRVPVWFGSFGVERPSNAVDIVRAERPYCRGDIVEGEQVGPDEDSYEVAKGRVLVIGIPVPQS